MAGTAATTTTTTPSTTTTTSTVNSSSSSSSSSSTCKAVCTIVSETGSNVVIGQLTLQQIDIVNKGPVKITGQISNLMPGKHGITICVAGNLTNGASSCGPIFNPFGKTHGSTNDEQRMVGDLGNIVVDDKGISIVNIVDNGIQLVGPHSIIGRSVVIYASEDDQGRGGHEQSLTTGNSGPRIAAGVIGIAL